MWVVFDQRSGKVLGRGSYADCAESLPSLVAIGIVGDLRKEAES